MANRTFKVYGQAYAASGDVSVAMTVGGTEVFNGAVNDSTTVRSGPPSTENHLWTYELDEDTAGNLAVSITVTGGELCLGPTKYNMVHYGDNSYVTENGFPKDATALTSADQTWLASKVTADEVGADIHARLLAGTANNTEDAAVVNSVIISKSDPETYRPDTSTRTSAQVNGVNQPDWDNDAVNSVNWLILQDGDAFTYTWNFSDPLA